MKKDLAFRAFFIAFLCLMCAISTTCVLAGVFGLSATGAWVLVGSLELYEARTGKQAIAWYKCQGLFWFRLFGKGLVFKNVNIHPPLFSERVAMSGFRIGKYIVRSLK